MSENILKESPYAISAAQLEEAAPHATVHVLAGFWARFAALIIDGFILGAVSSVMFFFIGILSAAIKDPSMGTFLTIIGFVVNLFISWLYFAIQESGIHRATIGKRAIGLSVTTLEGRQISFGHATGRWFAHALSKLTLWIGFLIQPLTQNKQALHDLVANTLVIRRKDSNNTVVAVVLALFFSLLVLIFIVGIIAGVAIPQSEGYKTAAERKVLFTATKNALTAYYATAVDLQAGQVPASIDELNLAPVNGIRYDYESNGQNATLTISSEQEYLSGKYIAYELPSMSCETNITDKPVRIASSQDCSVVQ